MSVTILHYSTKISNQPIVSIMQIFLLPKPRMLEFPPTPPPKKILFSYISKHSGMQLYIPMPTTTTKLVPAQFPTDQPGVAIFKTIFLNNKTATFPINIANGND